MIAIIILLITIYFVFSYKIENFRNPIDCNDILFNERKLVIKKRNLLTDDEVVYNICHYKNIFLESGNNYYIEAVNDVEFTFTNIGHVSPYIQLNKGEKIKLPSTTTEINVL